MSEYYYGIAEQRKLDLAARRIDKVIKLTEENDAMRAEYREKAAQLRDLIAKVNSPYLVTHICSHYLLGSLGARRPRRPHYRQHDGMASNCD